MSHIQQPLTLPKHPELLHDINEMSISIKVWHTIEWTQPNSDAMDKMKATHRYPTWEEVEQLLIRCRNAINEQRENPRKY